MNHWKKLAAAALVLALGSGIASAQDPAPKIKVKIGVVEMPRVYKEFERARALLLKIETQAMDKKAKLDGLRAEHAALLEQYLPLRKKIQDPALEESVRDQHMQTAEKLTVELRAIDTQLAETSRSRRPDPNAVALKTIIDEISLAVKAVSDQQGLDHVFDRNAKSVKGFPLIIPLPNNPDITDLVIEKLNAS